MVNNISSCYKALISIVNYKIYNRILEVDSLNLDCVHYRFREPEMFSNITNLSELSKNESLFYSYLILMPILVFIVFAGVEYLRKVILGGFFENYITVVSNKIDKESNRLKSKIENAKFDSEQAGEN